MLTHSYFLALDPKEAQLGKPYPPLAPIYLAAWLERELPVEVILHDVMFDPNPENLIEHIAREKPQVLIFYDDDFNFLTKMCLENMREAVFEVMERIDPLPLMLVHGSDAADQAESYLKKGFHFVVHRNAEGIILDMLRDFLAHGDKVRLRDCPGLSFMADHTIHQTPQTHKNLQLENAPPPAWEKLDLTPYRNLWREKQGYFSLNVATAHGCPYRCNWCAKPLYGRSYKAIQPEQAAREFIRLGQSLGANHIWVTDDIFALKPGWLTAFADQIEAAGVKIPYKCQNRADLINPEKAADLKRSGCEEVWLGVESGSQKILDAMDKDETLETIKIATRILQDHHIQVGFFLQYGYPGEQYSDIEATLALLKECLPDHIGISVSYPLKDTPFYERVKSEMGEKQNWRDSGDLAMMFNSPYHPDFYRALHQYTHHYFGFISLLRPQPLMKRLRRLAAQYRHIPGMIRYKRLMRTFL